jgi:GNAT superfamily N-acetyltransferase
LPDGYRYIEEVDPGDARRLLLTEFGYLDSEPQHLAKLWDGAFGVAHRSELVGLVFFSDDEAAEGRVARGDYLIVDPAHRSSGIARSLFGEFVRRAAERGYEGIVFETNRPRVERLYYRLGAELIRYERRRPPLAERALVRPVRRSLRTVKGLLLAGTRPRESSGKDRTTRT